MAEYVDVGPLDQLAAGSGRAAKRGDTTVAVFHVVGLVYAIDDACMRCGASLAAGKLEGTIVTCASCAWRYDVATGCVTGVPSLRLDTFPVEIVDAQVMVALDVPKAS